MHVKRLLVLSALSLTLTACGGTSSSSSIDSSTEEVSSGKTTYTSVENRGWSDELALKMANAFNGYVLPYIELTDIESQDDPDMEYFYIGGSFAGADLSAYVALVTADGFEVSKFEEEEAYSATKAGENYSYTSFTFYLDEGYFMLEGGYYRSTPSWPEEAIKADAELTRIESLPAYPNAEAYIYYAGYDYWTDSFTVNVECYGKSIAETSVAEYYQILTGAGFTRDDTYAEYGLEMYVKDNVTVDAMYLDDALLIYASYYDETEDESDNSDGAELEALVEFPADKIAQFLAGFEITTAVPSFDSSAYFYAEDEDASGPYAQIIGLYDTVEDALAVESKYTETLEQAGFTIDESAYEDYGIFAYDEGDTMELQYWADENDDLGPYFVLYVMSYEGSGEFTGEENFDLAVPGEKSTLSFESTSAMIYASEEECVWNNGAFSFDVKQNTSDIIVGNTGSYFTPSVRLYAGQTLTFRSDIAIESIEFTLDPDYKNNAGIFAESDFGRGNVNGTKVTLPADTKEYTVELAKQIRVKEITVTFAA